MIRSIDLDAHGHPSASFIGVPARTISKAPRRVIYPMAQGVSRAVRSPYLATALRKLKATPDLASRTRHVCCSGVDPLWWEFQAPSALVS